MVVCDLSQTSDGLLLCQDHSNRFTPPQGWTLISLRSESIADQDADHIHGLAQEIRRVGLGSPLSHNVEDYREYTLSNRPDLLMLAKRDHLRVVADSHQYAGNGYSYHDHIAKEE